MEGDDSRIRLSVRLLGPLRAFVGASEPPLGPPLRRAVLAVLAVRRDQVVYRGDLIDAVWGENLPRDPAGGLHTYVAGLRRVLEPVRPPRSPGRHIQSHASGYRLLLSPEGSDLAVFERLRDQGRANWRAGRNEAAERLFGEALGLFEGPPLGGVPGPFAGTQRSWLTEQRQSVAGDLVDVLLAQRRHDEAIAATRRLADEEPLRERTWAQLMLALYRDGRQADALGSFDRARAALAEALGLDPGPQLGALRQRIVESDPTLLDDAGAGRGIGAVRGAVAVWRREGVCPHPGRRGPGPCPDRGGRGPYLSPEDRSPRPGRLGTGPYLGRTGSGLYPAREGADPYPRSPPQALARHGSTSRAARTTSPAGQSRPGGSRRPPSGRGCARSTGWRGSARRRSRCTPPGGSSTVTRMCGSTSTCMVTPRAGRL